MDFDISYDIFLLLDYVCHTVHTKHEGVHDWTASSFFDHVAQSPIKIIQHHWCCYWTHVIAEELQAKQYSLVKAVDHSYQQVPGTRYSTSNY